VALAKNPRQVFQSVIATNAAQLADAAATFVVVRAKSNLALPTVVEVPNATEKPPSDHMTVRPAQFLTPGHAA